MLLDIEIPKSTIIENIDDWQMQCDAKKCFKYISGVRLRASLNQGDEYLQVIEIHLNKAKKIREITEIIQKTIKYQVLFVFVYRERFLITYRDFKVANRAENVSTGHISYCTNWIYIEDLSPDVLYYLQNIEIEEGNLDENEFISDVFKNVHFLNEALIESNIVCARYLFDWLKTHSLGGRINHLTLLENIREDEAFVFIGEHLYFHKNNVSRYLDEMTHSIYGYSLDHTGKDPTKYFEDCEEPATYNQESFWLSRLLYDDDEESFLFNDDPCSVLKYGGLAGYNEPRSTQLGFIDDIFRRYSLKQSGFISLEDANISRGLMRKLRRTGRETLESCESFSFYQLEKILTASEMIELLSYMDDNGLRITWCSVDEYADIDDYFKENIRCQCCGESLAGDDWNRYKRFCFWCDLVNNVLDEEDAREDILDADFAGIGLSEKVCEQLNLAGKFKVKDILDLEENELFTEYGLNRKSVNELIARLERYGLNLKEDNTPWFYEVVTPMDLPIEEMDLSIRSYNCLKRANKHTVADLAIMTETDYLKVRNLGRKSMEEIFAKLESYGIKIKRDAEF